MINYKTDREIQLVRVRERSAAKEPTAKSAITGREAAKDEELLVHNWRVARLAQFGIPESLAEVYADHIDWHQVARLVQRGCPPRLALRIVR